MIDQRFFQPQRQSSAAIVLFIYNFVVRILRGFWPVLVVIIFRSARQPSTYENVLNSLAILAGGFSLLVSIVSYFRYYYHLDEESLIIEKGVFDKTYINLPFERIQNIQIEQSVLHRMLNVVRLSIESAGSSGAEIKVEALERKQANAIRQYVLQQRAQIRQEKAEAAGTDYEELVQSFDAPRSTILKLHLNDLLKIGASQNHLCTAAIIFSSVVGFLFVLADTFNRDVYEEVVENYSDFDLNFYMFLALALVLIMAGFFLTLIRTIARYYGLQFSEDKEGFRLTAGLLNKREASLRKEKIQVIRWFDNPIRRLMGIFTLEIRQATAAAGTSSERVTIPGCYQNQVEDVVHSSFSQVQEAFYDEHRIDPAYISWYFRFMGIMPGLGFFFMTFATNIYTWLIPAIGAPVLAYFYLRAFYRRYRLYVSEEYVKTRSGVLSTEYALLPFYKIQSVDFQQSFYQRRRKLADVILYTAGGSERIPFLPVELARQLQDYALYRVETSRRDWM